MSKLLKKFWNWIPVWIKAISLVVLLLISLMTVIQVIIQLNVSFHPNFPWAFFLVVGMLFFFTQFLIGAYNIFGLQADLKRFSGVNAVKPRTMKWVALLSISLFIFDFSSIALGFTFLDQKNTVQLEFLRFICNAPIQTAIPLLFVLALTAGIIEEILFRGYLQKVLELNYGILISVIIVTAVFTIIHFLPIGLLLPYVLVSIGFCLLAYYTGSVIPCIIVHFLFDLAAFLMVYFNDDLKLIRMIEASLPLNISLLIVSCLLIFISIKRLKLLNNL